MTAPILRAYQEESVGQIRERFRAGNRAVLLVAPTGSGKTVVFSYISHHAVAKGNRVLVLVHRAELLAQVCRSLSDFGTPHAVIAPGHRMQDAARVQVGSVFTVARRLDRMLAPDLIVVDEAHHAVLDTTWGKVLAAFPRARVLGVTATPVRLSGEGLGECFQSLVLGPSVADLIDLGALSPYRIYAPPTIDTSGLHSRMGDFIKAELTARTDNATVTGDAVAHYQRHAAGRAAVVFCVSIAHAEHVAAQFTAAGFSAKSVDGRMDTALRRDIIGSFSAGRIHVLTSCDLVSEGFDCPRIEVGISLRPTQSLGLWLQQVGRCLRPWPGKEEALILDHAGNTMRHGLPDDPRDWSLAGRPARGGRATGDQGAVSVRICGKCFAANKSGRPTCSECGTPFPIAPREVEQRDGDLVEIERVRTRMAERQETWRAKTFEELVALGKKRGYKNPYAWAARISDWRNERAVGQRAVAAG